MKKIHFITALVLTMSTTALAYTTPAATDFAFDIYNVLVNKVLHGPLGYALAVFLIGFGAMKTIVHYDYSSASPARMLYYIAWIIAGTIILKIDNVMLSLGAVI